MEHATLSLAIVDVFAFFLHVGGHDHFPDSFPVFAGVLASMIHVVSGPDHLAAITPLVIESKRRAWRIGLFWGFGHLVGMLLIGGLFLLFKDFIPFEDISRHSERLVGVVLIAVGLWAFYRLFFNKGQHSHPHIHTGENSYVHIHPHQHEEHETGHSHHRADHEHPHSEKVRQNWLSSFGIGVLHGFAGIAHFLLLLPVLGFKSRAESVEYIVGFGIGTVVAMSVYALVLGALTKYSKRKGHDSMLFKGIRLTGGIFAVIIGVYWLLFAV